MKKNKTAKLPINIILLGDPAAGKATQSQFLVRKYHLYDFDMGKELRKMKRADEVFNKNLKDTYDKGKLTQTKFVRTILKSTITETSKSRGILFDGHPKMLGEAKLASSMLKKQGRQDPLVIYISIPIEETVKRMSGRVEYFKGKFSKRTDDTKAALRNRVKYYRSNIAQVVGFFSSKYPYVKVDGMGTVEQVRQRIETAIEELNSSNI